MVIFSANWNKFACFAFSFICLAGNLPSENFKRKNGRRTSTHPLRQTTYGEGAGLLFFGMLVAFE